MFKKLSLLAIIFLQLASLPALAKDKEDAADKKPVPRFVSLRSDEVNLRTGPGIRYPIKWIIKRKEMPVEVIAEYEDWRKLRDIEQDEGWVHKAMLSGRRTGLVKADNKKIYREADIKSKLVAVGNKGSLVKINKCDGKFCAIETLQMEGYIPQDSLYGVYDGEVFKK